MPCRPGEQGLRKFKSKDFMSDEKKIENEIIIQSTEGNKYVQVKNERELRKLRTESCGCATDRSGSWERIAILSIKRMKNNLLQISASKIQY